MLFMSTLFIAPHADDEILGCGATISKLKRNEEDIHLIICSQRKQDLVIYQEVYDQFTSYNLLPFEDEKLNSYYLLKSIEKIYNKLKPKTIYIPNKDDFNLDHKEVYKACEVVLRRFQKHQPMKILMYETPSSTTQSFNNNFKCNYYEEIDEIDLKYKVNTFKKYKNELRQYPNPRSTEGILTYAKFRGMECNSLYAEGFNLIYQKS